MIAYVVRRILWIIPVLFVISLITFILMHMTPGGPFDTEKAHSAAVTANLMHKYGLDKPLPAQYALYLWHAMRGDFGISYIYQNRTVSSIILSGMPTTGKLAALAFGVAVALGIGLGTLAALRQNSLADYLSLGFATAGASTPNFVWAMMLVVFFSLTLHWFPTGGWGSPKQMVLPVLALAFTPAAYVARITRASILEVIRQDYVRTARAKGMQGRIIVWRHVLRNGLIPVVTVLGPIFAGLFSGSFIIESIFSIPGTGRLFVQAISARDYPLIMGTTLFYALIIVFANLIVDLLYAVIDPRIRYS
ncbi:MAG: ABC transporter permease [Chloroflexi bacterium]|nr:ABC transporter permease [Chloroflexota bacterium]